MINRRALFSFFAALPLVGAGLALSQINKADWWADGFKPLGPSKLRTVYGLDVYPWPNKEAAVKALRERMEQHLNKATEVLFSEQPLPAWREQIKFEAVPLSTITNK